MPYYSGKLPECQNKVTMWWHRVLYQTQPRMGWTQETRSVTAGSGGGRGEKGGTDTVKKKPKLSEAECGTGKSLPGHPEGISRVIDHVSHGDFEVKYLFILPVDVFSCFNHLTLEMASPSDAVCMAENMAATSNTKPGSRYQRAWEDASIQVCHE